MVRESSGFRSGTRKKLRQKLVRPSMTKFLKEFKIGQRVVIALEPSSQKGMPFPRFKGRMGNVIEKRGRSYVVEILDGNKRKKIISKPEHIKAI